MIGSCCACATPAEHDDRRGETARREPQAAVLLHISKLHSPNAAAPAFHAELDFKSAGRPTRL
jgi:hypothetical protein